MRWDELESNMVINLQGMYHTWEVYYMLGKKQTKIVRDKEQKSAKYTKNPIYFSENWN